MSQTGSILRKLQWGFAAGALVLSTLLALFMERALQESFEAEDAQVMQGQAQPLLRDLAAGRLPRAEGQGAQLEKAEWRVLDSEGRMLAQSPFMARMPSLVWPKAEQPPAEVEGPRGGTYSVCVRTWRTYEGRGGTLLLAMDRTHEEALIRGFRRTLLLAVAASAIGAALLGRLIAAWGLAPLKRIVRDAGGIDDQHLDRRLEAASFPAELQELVATLNGALERLQGAFTRLDHLGAELAHELRTPLQHLRSTLENLVLQAQGPQPPEDLSLRLGGLLEACDRMAALIEQILFLARREALGGDQKPVALPPLLEEVREFFEAAAEEAGVGVRTSAQAGLILQGDPLLLLRALHNLVANALRHAPQGSVLELGCRTEGGELCLWVQDAGPGFPPELLPRLGQPFLRGAGGGQGLGLGLALVKRIAQLHGGRLELRNAGSGARAELRFPDSMGNHR